MSILLFLSNRTDKTKIITARELINQSSTTIMKDFEDKGTDEKELIRKKIAVISWHAALMTFETDPNGPDRHEQILKLIDAILDNCLESYQKLKKSLEYSEDFVKFIGSLNEKNTQAYVDKARPLFIKLLFGPDEIEKSTEDELIAAGNKGPDSITMRLARMYAHGIYIKKSLSTAVSFLKKSIEADTQFNQNKSTLLEEISQSALVKQELVTFANAKYLQAFQWAQQSCEQKIVECILSVEEILKLANQQKQAEIVETLYSSNACKTLIPIASKSSSIAQTLYDVAKYRVQSFGHPKERYTDIFELARKSELYWTDELSDDTVKKTTALLTHFLGTDKAKKLKEEFSQLVDVSHPECVLKQFHDFLTQRFKQENYSQPVLLALLQYLDGDCPNGKPFATLLGCHEKQILFTEWNQALLQLVTEEQCQARDDEILIKLAHGLAATPVMLYPQMKDLLVFDEQLLQLVVNIATNDPENYRASTVLAKLFILFGQKTRLDKETALQYLHKAHTHGYTEASVCLAQSYMWYESTLVEISPRSAIATLQTATNLNPCADIDIFKCLLGISQAADHDPIAQLHAFYLMIVQQINHNNLPDTGIDSSLNAITENLEFAVLKFVALSPDEQAEALPLLTESGAYRSLLPLAKDEPEIARLLRI